MILVFGVDTSLYLYLFVYENKTYGNKYKEMVFHIYFLEKNHSKVFIKIPNLHLSLEWWYLNTN